MDFSWAIKYATEFLGTAILIILGNGAVANVELKGTKGHQSGWLVIAVGYGMGVMIPALMFGNTSGNHINPAFTLALAILLENRKSKQYLGYFLNHFKSRSRNTRIS